MANPTLKSYYMKKPILACFAILLTLLALSCKPDPVGGPLENSFWVLKTAKSGMKTFSPSEGGTKISLAFDQGRLSGDAPCNAYFADFSAEGSNLSVGAIGATKRMCEEMDVETAYLSLLAKAKAYSVLKDRLVVYCENGELSFVPMGEQASATIRQRQGLGKLEALFPLAQGDGMSHLFPILKVDNPGDYPYMGVPIDTAFFQYFDEETSEVWASSGGDVMAIGKLDEFFLCRLPGRYVSSDLAIFRSENGRLRHVETIAWAWCDEGWCNQQDAWLRDLDKDGRIDLIQHYTLTDDQGKLREERITALLQDENGDFVEDKALQPEIARFKMAKL